MRDELRRHFPDLDETGMTSTYYFDGADDGCLGLARVDAGQRGRWDRVVESIREDIDTHCSRQGFQKLIADRSFEISILTVHPQKAARIRQALSEKSDAQRIPIRIVRERREKTSCFVILLSMVTLPGWLYAMDFSSCNFDVFDTDVSSLSLLGIS